MHVSVCIQAHVPNHYVTTRYRSIHVRYITIQRIGRPHEPRRAPGYMSDTCQIHVNTCILWSRCGYIRIQCRYIRYICIIHVCTSTHPRYRTIHTYVLHTPMIHVYRLEIHVSDVYRSVSVSRYTQIRIESKLRHF